MPREARAERDPPPGHGSQSHGGDSQSGGARAVVMAAVLGEVIEGLTVGALQSGSPKEAWAFMEVCLAAAEA